MKKKKYIDANKDEKIRLVSMDIIKIKVEAKDTMHGLVNKFYSIMRKHKIKLCHSDDGGKTFRMASFEWTICKNLFKSQVSHYFDFMEWGFKNAHKIPKDLDR